jgi:hypothetical protein
MSRNKKKTSNVLFLPTVKSILDYFKNSMGIEGLPDLDEAIKVLKPLNVKFSRYTYLEALKQWEEINNTDE